MYSRYIKRCLDLLVSGTFIILLLPLFMVISILIRVETKGCVLFTQERVGKRGVKFNIIKFRTMLIFDESFYPDGTSIENYKRVTKVGKILRKTSIDELPQLINILIGDMSIVGPRPTLSYQVERYNDIQVRRLNVRPGLTGLAQVKGRNSINWERKIQYDLEYVENITFLKDINIIMNTFSVVLKSEKVDFTAHDAISKHAGDIVSDVNVSIKADIRKKP